MRAPLHSPISNIRIAGKKWVQSGPLSATTPVCIRPVYRYISGPFTGPEPLVLQAIQLLGPSDYHFDLYLRGSTQLI